LGQDVGSQVAGMKIRTFQSTSNSLVSSQDWLEEQEVENSLILGLALRIQKDPGREKEQPFFGVVEGSVGISNAALMTPPYNLIVAGDPGDEPLSLLADKLSSASWTVPGVSGPHETASAFSRAWSRGQRKQAQLSGSLRLYKLTEVTPPEPVAGRLRTAGA
jgi:hypothetical protein